MSDRLGELVVVAIEAKNLSTRDIIGKGDPFAEFNLDGESKKIKAEKRGGQHPHWDEEVRFTLSKNTSKKLKIQVFNEDRREHILIGEATIELKEVLEKTEWDSWHEIRYNNKYAGEVLLEMTFYYSERPPSLNKQLPNAPPTQVTQQPPSVNQPNQPPVSSAPTSGYPPQNIYPPPNSKSPPPNVYPPPQNVYNSTPPSSKPPQFNEPKRSQSPASSQYPPVAKPPSSQYPPVSSSNSGYPPTSNVYSPPQSQGYPPATGSYPPVSSPPGSYPQITSSTGSYPPTSSPSFRPTAVPPSSGSSQGSQGGLSFPVPIPTPAPVSSTFNAPYPPQYNAPRPGGYNQSPYPPNYPPQTGGNIYPPPNQGYPYPPY